jgi:hypothetical protein
MISRKILPKLSGITVALFLLVSILVTLFITNNGQNLKVFAQAITPVIPTVYCLGSCPTNVPSGVVAPSSGGGGGSGGGSGSGGGGGNAPSGTVTQPSVSIGVPTTDPCATTANVHTAARSSRHRGHARGGLVSGSFQQLLNLLLQLINMILQMLGLPPIQNPGGPTPSGAPVPSGMPITTGIPIASGVPGSSATVNPCPTAVPSTIVPTTGQPTTTQPTTVVPTTAGGTAAPTVSTTGWWKPTSDKPIQLHWQLTGQFNPATDFVPGATVYDIDGEGATKADVDAIHAKGFKAICYFDAGVYEDYRSDAASFPKSVIGAADTGWAGSFWLDIRQQSILKPIMEARIKNWCSAKGFDAVEPDETEVWNNNPGFPITQADNISYGKMIADLVHSYNMAVGLKGNNAEAASYSSFTDWSLSEQCYEYSECDNLYNSFAAKNKAVWIVEYNTTPNCADANSKHMNAQKRDLNLVGPVASGYLFQPCKPVGSTAW